MVRYNMNVLIPMAGAGKRFFDAGYVFPKPLIEVNNKPMIQWVIEVLTIRIIFYNPKRTSRKI